MPIININNCKYYYELHGNGTPLVLIAGLRSDHTRWFPILKNLATKYQVLIFDNRGAGQTIDSGESFTVETMAHDTINLISKLGLNKPHIVGHSLGGAVAQQIAREYSNQISSIALCNTFIKLNKVARNFFNDILALHKINASQSEIMDRLAPWIFSKSFLTRNVIKLLKRTANENPYPQSLSGYTRQLDALFNFDSGSWVNTIKLPTLIIGSREDKIAIWQESKKLAINIFNSKLAMISTGHGSPVERPDEFVDHLHDFYNNLFS